MALRWMLVMTRSLNNSSLSCPVASTKQQWLLWSNFNWDFQMTVFGIGWAQMLIKTVHGLEPSANRIQLNCDLLLMNTSAARTTPSYLLISWNCHTPSIIGPSNVEIG